MNHLCRLTGIEPPSADGRHRTVNHVVETNGMVCPSLHPLWVYKISVCYHEYIRG